MPDSTKMTRREAIKRAASVVAAGAMGIIACDGRPGPSATESTMSEVTEQKPPQPGSTTRMPAVFLPHGGGPWPFVHKPMGTPGMWDDMRVYMEKLSLIPPETPKAVLVISAHWEAPTPTVMASPKPPMLYDYYGFPPESYEVQWPAPGAPEVAGEIQSLLSRAGFSPGRDATRGFDHGVFVPLKLGWPQADVPALQLSLKQGLDSAEHVRIGRAIAPLRDQGVFIVGSGMSYHNLRAIMAHLRGGPAPMDASRAFDEWLAESMALSADKRETRLVEWKKAPAARACHPREEHLLPLHVVAGAAEDAEGALPYRDVVLGAHVSAVHFG